jgi:hypothetical protein
MTSLQILKSRILRIGKQTWNLTPSVSNDGISSSGMFCCSFILDGNDSGSGMFKEETEGVKCKEFFFEPGRVILCIITVAEDQVAYLVSHY